MANYQTIGPAKPENNQNNELVTITVKKNVVEQMKRFHRIISFEMSPTHLRDTLFEAFMTYNRYVLRDEEYVGDEPAEAVHCFSLLIKALTPDMFFIIPKKKPVIT